jgi:hypothetical protein
MYSRAAQQVTTDTIDAPGKFEKALCEGYLETVR